ncbi:hypothetical protein L7F22_007680 [Adiantum nelumboides]|nr:hypothetical protein [Adiantum nelumboides]
MYKGIGMVTPQEWKLCVGTEDMSHDPQVFAPSPEDAYEGAVLKCGCSIEENPSSLVCDCKGCCERCQLCHKPRKDMISFQYISFMEQFRLICASETFCHDFLAMWRERGQWLNKEACEYPAHINKFWDGEKMRVYQDFWNPDRYWEVPVICNNEFCKQAYTTFPKESRSPELIWSEPNEEYQFTCSKCHQDIRAKRKMIQGDPRNFALMLQDGFQAASTTMKDSAVVEIVVMNGGKRSILGSLPVLFLPLSHRDLEIKHNDILGAFLHPLFLDLEKSFVEGFDLHYAYPSNDICDKIQGGRVTLRSMLMLCTGDHPAQCKLGQVKDGGMSFCKGDKAKATFVGERYVYDANRYQGRYPPKKRHVEKMWRSVKKSKRCMTKNKKEETLRKGVYDSMHILSLNLFQKYLRKLVSTASTSMKEEIDMAVKEKGWTQDDIKVCRSLLLSWRILLEEWDGPNSSPLEHVAGNGEILDDILRHGSHDYFWCFSFERCVSGGYLEDKARDVWNACCRLLPSSCKGLVDNKGLIVGGKEKMFTLSAFEKDSLLTVYNWNGPPLLTLENIFDMGVFYFKAFLHGCKYAQGDYVVFEDKLSHACQQGVVLCRGRLKKIFLHEQGDELQLFMVVESLVQEIYIMDEVTGMPLVQTNEKSNHKDMVRPLAWLKHKFFLSRSPINGMEIMYEVSGHKVRGRLVQRGQLGDVPPWPELGDHVIAFSHDCQMKHAFIVEVDEPMRKVLTFWLDDEESELFWLDWKSIVTVLPGYTEGKADEGTSSQHHCHEPGDWNLDAGAESSHWMD